MEHHSVKSFLDHFRHIPQQLSFRMVQIQEHLHNWLVQAWFDHLRFVRHHLNIISVEQMIVDHYLCGKNNQKL